MNLGRANLDELGAVMLAMGQADRDLLVVTSDSRGSGKLVPFGRELPAQIIEVGIAEQNLVGMSAGLASAGKTVFAVSPACFLTARSLEQIKNDVAYSDNAVKLIGISAGVSYGALGSTHHSLHDFAVLRAIHNMIVMAPADNFETRAALHAAAATPHPVYLRFGKRPAVDLHTPDTSFTIGKAIQLSQGADVTFVATGETVALAVQAAELLAAVGVAAGVVSMHTIKPLDNATLLQVAHETRAIITVEEHSVFGGLGSACAEVLMQAGVARPFRIVGIPDEYTVTGSQTEIFAHYGLTPAGLAATATDLLQHEVSIAA